MNYTIPSKCNQCINMYSKEKISDRFGWCINFYYCGVSGVVNKFIKKPA